MDVLTKTLPSLAVAPDTVCLLPSTRTKVEDSPKPLRLMFEVPCVPPCVKESDLFSDPEFTAILFVISAMEVAPRSSISDLSTISTGEAPSVGLDLI